MKLHSNYNHIEEIWEDFAKCKNEIDIQSIIDNIPRKFGDFYYEISEDGRTFKVTNNYEEFGEFQTDTIELDFLELGKIRNIEVKTLFHGWKEVSYERAKECVQNWMNGILTKSGQEKVDYINTELIKGITVQELLEYKRQQDKSFERNLDLWKDGIGFANDRIKTFYDKQKDSKDIKYITIKEVGENYSKRMANLMFELGYGEWVFRDYGQIDKMQEQMIGILQDDDDLKEILNKKGITKNNLFKQIEGYILKGEIEESIYNKEEYAEFIKEKINEYLTGGWLKQNEFDFLSTNLSELSEKCFNELRDDMSLEEELNMIDKNIKSMLEGITENISEER